MDLEPIKHELIKFMCRPDGRPIYTYWELFNGLNGCLWTLSGNWDCYPKSIEYESMNEIFRDLIKDGVIKGSPNHYTISSDFLFDNDPVGRYKYLKDLLGEVKP